MFAHLVTAGLAGLLFLGAAPQQGPVGQPAHSVGAVTIVVTTGQPPAGVDCLSCILGN